MVHGGVEGSGSSSSHHRGGGVTVARSWKKAAPADSHSQALASMMLMAPVCETLSESQHSSRKSHLGF